MKKLAALVLLLLVTPLTAKAGTDRWTPFGRGDDTVLDLLLTPEGLYTLAIDRPFRSTDGGEVWQYRGVGLGFGIRRIAADPADPAVMAAVSTYGDVYLSTDAGRFWSRLPHLVDEELDPAVSALTMAAGTIYVGGRYLYISRDHGETWSTASPVVGFMPSIVLDPTDLRTVWFPTGNGLWKTTDAGATFTLTLNPPYEIGVSGVTAVAVAPSRPATVYAGANRRLYASQDGGATWQAGPRIGPGIGIGDLSALLVDPADPARVYAAGPGGIALSQDGGATWTVLDAHATGTLLLAPDGTLFAGTYGDGLQASRDGGRTWARRDRVGMGYPQTAFVERDPLRPRVLYLSHFTNGFGFLRSLDDGRTWSPFGGADGVAGYLVDLAFDGRRPGVLYGVTPFNGAWRIEPDGKAKKMALPTQREMYTVATSGRAVLVGNSWAGYRSEDGGRTWKDVLPHIVSREAGGDVVRAVLRLIEDPRDRDVLYALTNESGLGVNRDVALRSDDGGLRWRRIRTGNLHALAVDPHDAGTVYSVEIEGDRIALYRSRDRGNRWRRIGTIPGPADGRVTSLVVDTKDPDALWASDDLGVLRSADGGRTWTPFNAGLVRPGLTDFVRLATDPAVPGRLYAMPVGGGLFELTTP